MRVVVAALVFAGFTTCVAHAEDISSAYSDLDAAKDCTTFDIDEESGAFSAETCNGYGGYPVLIYSGDLRTSMVYGFPGTDDHVWESFTAFNSVGPKIEWRVLKDGDKTIPFATIHRWSVSDPEDSEKQTEVLVVAKVGQVNEPGSCAVGLVLATGNPKANEIARKIADEQVRGFSCGDERVLVGEPMPPYERENPN